MCAKNQAVAKPLSGKATLKGTSRLFIGERNLSLVTRKAVEKLSELDPI